MEDEISKVAKIDKLNPYAYLAIVDTYGKAYGKLPREVNAERFDDVMPMLLLWKEQREFINRYREADKNLNK